jgi:lipoprotein NlpI
MGDLDAADADFTHAVSINAKFATAYASRGIVDLQKGDIERAWADYSRCIELAPKLAPGYNGRGIIKLKRDDLDGANADFEFAIHLAPKFAPAYNNRAIVKKLRGDTSGAASDLDRAMEAERNHALTYRHRGQLFFVNKKWSDALREFRMSAETASDDQDYGRLLAWVVRLQLGENEAATQELVNYFAARASRAPKDWTTRILSFVLGKISEEDFRPPENLESESSTAGQEWYLVNRQDRSNPGPRLNAGRICEAWFYAGMKRLAAGDKAKATEFFQKCVTTGQKTFIEFDLAATELKTLGH